MSDTITVNVVDEVYAVISEATKPPLAKEIAAILNVKFGWTLERRDVNSILYSDLKNKVCKNARNQWEL